MADKMITRHQIVRDLAALRWRIAKLEEIKNGKGLTEQMLGTEEEFFNQSQSSQFFLGLGSSHVVKTEDESTIKEDI